jgi:hypothetical protein
VNSCCLFFPIYAVEHTGLDTSTAREQGGEKAKTYDVPQEVTLRGRVYLEGSSVTGQKGGVDTREEVGVGHCPQACVCMEVHDHIRLLSHLLHLLQCPTQPPSGTPKSRKVHMGG